MLAAVEKEFPDLNKIIEYGWFGAIAKVMLKGITFIHGFLPNYGWAIILFTLFLKLILFPLTYSSSVSMAKMQSLQPKMKAIKKKYKNTKDMEQRKLMNMEMMALYKQEKVNPAGGCLPLLLQLPLLWGIFPPALGLDQRAPRAVDAVDHRPVEKGPLLRPAHSDGRDAADPDSA